MAEKSKQRSKRGPFPKQWTMSKAMSDQLAEVERLLRRKRLEEAQEILEDINRRYPNHPAVLTEVVNLAYDKQDLRDYQRYCQRLHKATPKDPDVLFNLAGAYMSNIYPALALQTYHLFIDRYPTHDRIEDARQRVAEVEPMLHTILSEFRPAIRD